jgi:HlyD family secretion protein
MTQDINRLWLLVAVTAGAISAYTALAGRDRMPVEVAAAAPAVSAQVVAAGRVEPVSEEVEISSELDGKLREITVEEGQRVSRGQVLATLVNNDYLARVRLAEASVAQAEAVIREREADLERVVNGFRAQERGEADAMVLEARAVLAQAESERRRREQLLDRGAIARTEYDVAEREFQVARARVEVMNQRASLTHEGSRREDRQRAEAELARAKADLARTHAQLAEMQAVLQKTIIRSPIDGVVLRKKMRSGEAVAADRGQVILTVGDTSRLRIRADVDETDVARIKLGQTAYVTAAAYGDRKFTGRVVRIGEILGRKNIRTDQPNERVDTKILETLIDLEPGQTLPVGLRVDTFIEAGGRS